MPDSSAKFMAKYRIASNRLKGWDYSSPGYYFITICTLYGISWFGEFINNQMLLTPIGEIVSKELERTPQHRHDLEIVASVIMPNHIHAIFNLHETHVETPRRGVSPLFLSSRSQRSLLAEAIFHPFLAFCYWKIYASRCILKAPYRGEVLI